MYSSKIVERHVSAWERKSSIKLIRYEIGQAQDIRSNLDKLFDDGGKLRRALTRNERSFIANEQILCAFDFPYWAERYSTIQLDQGGVGRFNPWISQQIFLKRLADREEEIYAQYDAGDPVEGLLFVAHKDRQLGLTMLSRLLLIHRMWAMGDIRGMSASVDPDKVMELYDRDWGILDNLPFYLKPTLGYNVKGQHIYFETNKSRMLYQEASMKSGLGQGRQFDISHLTECASWDAIPGASANIIEYYFFPTIPQSIRALSILESTADGRGNWWHEFTERVRRGLVRRWRYVFIPYYVEPAKYRAKPHPAWTPSELTLAHARLVNDTSPEFTNGKAIELSLEQMYWYEMERASAQSRGRLNMFLTNYAATPEESFQHSSNSAFAPELLEKLRLAARPGIGYELYA